MSATSRSSGSLLTWLLALALLVSVGINLYNLTPDYHSARSSSATALNTLSDDDDDDDESWAALTEELRATRQQLAACQGYITPDTTTTIP
jgi:hypothetical protein